MWLFVVRFRRTLFAEAKAARQPVSGCQKSRKRMRILWRPRDIKSPCGPSSFWPPACHSTTFAKLVFFYADKPYYNQRNQLVIALFFVLYICVYDALCTTLGQVSKFIGSQGPACIIADAILHLATWQLTRHPPSILMPLGTLVFQVLVAFLWYLGTSVVFSLFSPKSSRRDLRSAKGTGAAHFRLWPGQAIPGS